MKIALLAMILLVFVSGCTVFDFGSDVIKINQARKEEGVKDVMEIGNVQTIPKSPVLPDQPLMLSMTLENKDKTKDASVVRVDLFDAPLLKSSEGALCNSRNKPCRASVCGSDACVLLPAEQKYISFDLLSPTENEIANIKQDINPRFTVNYDFKGETTLLIPVVNVEEVKKLQRQGKEVAIDSPHIVGSGPVKVNIETTQKFLLAGYGTTLLFTVEDVGNGDVLNSKIKKDDLSITFPGDISITSDTGPLFLFDCERGKSLDTPETEGRTCQNTREIDLFLGKSMPLRFELKAPEIGKPFESYQIKADVKYTYELRGSAAITVKPYGS